MRRALAGLIALGIAVGLSGCGGNAKDPREMTTKEAVDLVNKEVVTGGALTEAEGKQLFESVCEMLRTYKENDTPIAKTMDDAWKTTGGIDVASFTVIMRSSLWSECPDMVDYVGEYGK